MANLYQTLLGLLPQRPLQLATVTAVDGEQCRLELPGGGVLVARGTASVGDTVLVRDGLIEAKVPSMPIVTGDI